jgi:uncharacterized repeat protein (TIGR04052 family)
MVGGIDMQKRLARSLVTLVFGALPMVASVGCDDGHTHGDTTTSGSSSSGGGEGGAGGGGGAGGAGGGMNAQAIEINFEARVGSLPFRCQDKFASVGMSGAEISFTDFRFYVHDVRLVTADSKEVPVELDQDGKWQAQNVALLDFEDKAAGCSNGTVETNTKIIGKVPAGTYTGLVFNVGVPFDLNHNDSAAAPSPLNLTALFWTWNSGYKFMRIDAVPSAGGGPFLWHLGSTGCVEDMSGKVTSCDRPNRPMVQFAAFDTTKNKVIIDYAALAANNDVAMNGGGAPGCMSGMDDPDCASLFGQLGIHMQDGTVHPEEQKVFTKE